MNVSGDGRIGWTSGYPVICICIVSAPGVENCWQALSSTPDDHVISSPDCRMPRPASGCIGYTGGSPIVSHRIISAARIKVVRDIVSAPDDHLTARPYCRVRLSRGWGISSASR